MSNPVWGWLAKNPPCTVAPLSAQPDQGTPGRALGSSVGLRWRPAQRALGVPPGEKQQALYAVGLLLAADSLPCGRGNSPGCLQRDGSPLRLHLSCGAATEHIPGPGTTCAGPHWGQRLGVGGQRQSGTKPQSDAHFSANANLRMKCEMWSLLAAVGWARRQRQVSLAPTHTVPSACAHTV